MAFLNMQLLKYLENSKTDWLFEEDVVSDREIILKKYLIC